ncbi:GtrA family protein [Polaromonas sp. P5_D5]
MITASCSKNRCSAGLGGKYVLPSFQGLLELPISKFLRFLTVGLLNTGFGYGLFAILSLLGMPYPVAIGLATVAGIAFNFQTTGRLVFDGAPRSRLMRFVAVYVLIYGLNVGGVALLLAAGLNLYAANAIVLLPLALIAYKMQQKFVFAMP